MWLGSEDCLYLNVYSPANSTASSRLPVLVWLYGGAFVFGDGYEFGLYSATNLVSAHQSYVAVTFNYRLAALGFLSLDSLRLHSPSNSSGNAGIWDQIAALEWVRDNVGAFGGDSSRVTIVGESAGAMSVCIHLASRHSRGLFSAAIMESGTCDSDAIFASNEASVEWSKAFAHSVGCSGGDSDELVECMQRLPVDKLVEPSNINASTQSHSHSHSHSPLSATAAATPTALSVLLVDFHGLPNTLQTVQQLYSHAIPLWSVAAFNRSVTPIPPPLLYPAIPWTPAIDSSLLLDTPLASIASGDWARVPLVVGTNKDEGSLFISALYSVLPGQLHDPLVASDLPLILLHVFGNDSAVIESVLAAYPVSAYSSVNNLTQALVRDWFFACPSRRLAAAATSESAGGSSVWLYEFGYLGDWVEDRELGVYHSSELEFVFNNAWPPLVHSFSPRDQQMAAAFGSYWANLVVNRDVNVGEANEAAWEKWTAADKRSLRLDVPIRAEQSLHAEVCDLWDAVAAKRRKQTHHNDGGQRAHVRAD